MNSPGHPRRRRYRAARLFVVLGAGGCLASPFPKTPEAGGPPWQQITSEHFVVDTDLDPKEAEAIVRQLENLRKVETQVVFDGEPPPDQRMRVLALRQDEYAQFDRIAAGTFVSWTLFQPMLVISPGGEWDTFASDTRKHELGHYVSSLYIDMRLQPRWFAEGTAAYLETIRYDAATGAVEIGHHPPDYQYLDLLKQASYEELWAWDGAAPYDALTARLYETSWAVVHYLFDQRPAELLNYESALAHGEDAKKSWAKIFPELDGPGLDETIAKYIHKRDYKITKATVPAASTTLRARPLREAEVLADRATLYMALQANARRTTDESKALASQNVAASLGYEPGNFWAHQVNFFYFDTVPTSVPLAKQSVADETDNWLAWVWYAEVLRRAKQPVDDRRAALSKALELAPRNSLALTQMAWAEAARGNWKGALETSERAVRSPPVSPDTMAAYAVALSHSGRCGDARMVEERLAKRLKNDVPKDVAGILDENHKICGGEKAETPPGKR